MTKARLIRAVKRLLFPKNRKRCRGCGRALSEWFIDEHKGTMWCYACGWISPWKSHED